MYSIKMISLKPYNTFGIEAQAATLIEINNVADLVSALATVKKKRQPIYILGGGSNILFTRKHYAYCFLKNNIKGIEVVEDKTDSKIIKIGGGEVWQDVVNYALTHDLGGIENLSLIPGTMGAAPIQNIGAYGVELKDVFVKLEAICVDDGQWTMDNGNTSEKNNLSSIVHCPLSIVQKKDCQFGYRDSIFKNVWKGKYFITHVYLELTKSHAYKINIGYGDIQRILNEKKITAPSIQEISEAVIEIRQSKLPDPKQIGNAGSFFKNSEISLMQLQTLKEKFPNIVSYPTPNGAKLAAGWLIEQCGWRGFRKNNIGVHERQALVIVNYGDGTGNEIKKLSAAIQKSVLKKFGVALAVEVNFV